MIPAAATPAVPADPASHVPVIPPPRFFFITAAALAAFFILWSILVFNTAIIQAFDDACATHWHDWSHDHPNSWKGMVFFTDLGGIASMALLAVMGAIWQTAINHRVLAVAWLAIVVGGAILNMGSKDSFQRNRPPASLRERVVHETNHSYPSGHAMGSAIGYGMLGYALILPQRRRPRRVAALLLMAGLILMVGFSRIYLRAHWFSDVVAGWSIGLAWLFFCLGWLERRRLRLASSPITTT